MKISSIAVNYVWVNPSIPDDQPTLLYRDDGSVLTYGELRRLAKSLASNSGMEAVQ